MFRKILFLSVFFIASSLAQDSYTISWDNNSDTYSWDIYLEIRTLPYGFTLKDGIEYNSSLNSFWIANVKRKNNNARVTYKVTINRNNVSVKAGVIAKKNGIKSKLGTTKIKKIKSKPNV